MRVSILTPKAFSIRRAMLPESAALPFRRLDKAPRNVQCGRGGGDAEACGLDDFRADEIAGVRRILHGHGNCSFDLIIVFRVQIADFATRGVNSERQTPVAGDGQAPNTLAVAGQGMRLPGRERTQFFGVLRGVKKSEHLAELIRRIGRNTLCAVFRVVRSQALVSEAPNSHMIDCSL